LYIDYTDLNKHYSKDPFGLPRIDQVVNSTTDYSMLSFLDCYSGYHQISLAEEDQEKNDVHHALLLYLHVIWPKKRLSDLSAVHPILLS
jgi:hypothetical protein